MRILHVIGWLSFADGGPPVIATRLAAAQAQRGHDVSIAMYSSGLEDRQTDEQLSRLPHWKQVKVHRFPPASGWERLVGTRAGRGLKPLIDAADVVHLHNVWEGILLQAARYAYNTNKPYLILLNGMLDPWALAQRPLKKKFALAVSHRRMLDRCSMLHLGNEDERRLIEPLGIKAPATIIPNGVTLEEIDPLPPRGAFLAAHPELEGRRFILFLSRLHYMKGLDYLANAYAIVAKRHGEIDLVVAGPDGGERESFERAIGAAGLSDQVHIVGPLYGREKFAALVDCECFTLPSRREGFSVAILEAMAAKAPVVISEGCHFPEVATGGAGEVVALNAHGLAAALDRVLSNAHRARLGETGRAMIEANYTWGPIAQRTVGVYEQTVCALKSR